MQLYTYFRSSVAFRARIAFNVKNVSPEMTSVHLTRNGGAQFEAAYRAMRKVHASGAPPAPIEIRRGAP